MRLGPILKLSWFVVKFVVKEVAYEIAFKTIADGPRAHPLGYFGAMVAVAGAVVLTTVTASRLRRPRGRNRGGSPTAAPPTPRLLFEIHVAKLYVAIRVD